MVSLLTMISAAGTPVSLPTTSAMRLSGISIGGSRSSTSISLTPVRACGNAIETMPPNLPLAFGDQDRGSSLLIPPFAASS